MVRFFNSMITKIALQSKILSTSDTESNRTFHGKDYSAYRHSIEHFISKISPPHISREGLIFVLLLAVCELNHSTLLLRNRSKHILQIIRNFFGNALLNVRIDVGRYFNICMPQPHLNILQIPASSI